MNKQMKIPELVKIPSGTDIHGNKIESFDMGVYAVTFDEYDAFCKDTNRELPSDEGWGRGSRPVINVSWHDAQAYCQWLSDKTGYLWELPTSKQWEYAARAGSKTSYWWGDKPMPDKLHLMNTIENSESPQTVPVHSFLPNPWGLYQVHGNVWEWCQDTYEKGLS